jgi:hypothetical protein
MSDSPYYNYTTSDERVMILVLARDLRATEPLFASYIETMLRELENTQRLLQEANDLLHHLTSIGPETITKASALRTKIRYAVGRTTSEILESRDRMGVKSD